MSDYLRKIVKLTKEQYERIVADGSITVDGVTYTYDANDLYLTPEDEAYIAEAYARGTIKGVPVTEGQDGYNDNAKYYAGQAAASSTTAAGKAGEAAASAQNASDKATAAAGSASDASGYATAASGSASDASGSATAASGSASAASGSAASAGTNALKAEGFAVGKQNGEDVGSDSVYYHNNAKYYCDQSGDAAASAGTNALKAEGFAVGTQDGEPSETYGENNAKYYAEQAAEGAAAAQGIIDDTAGAGATGKTWSANKLAAINADVTALKTEISEITYSEPGKNLYDPAACHPADGKVYSSTGEYATHASYACTGKIPVQPYTQYVFSAGGARVYSVRFFSGTTGGTFISGKDLSSGTFITPETCTFIAVNLFGATHTTEQYNAAIASAQLELGRYATAYEPYTEITYVKKTNVEDGQYLTEFEDISYTQIGKNLYNASACHPVDNYAYTSDGSYSATSNYATTGKIPVSPSTRYVFSAGGARVYSVRYFKGKYGETFISGENIEGAPFTTPSTCTFIAVNLFGGSHTSAQYEAAIAAAQLELGSIATAYEPYTETTCIKKTNIQDGSNIDAVAEITTKESRYNLYDKSLAVDGKYLSSGGGIASSENYAITGMIPVKPSTQYCLSIDTDAPMTLSNVIYEYSQSNTFLRTVTVPDGYYCVRPFVTDPDAYYVNVNMTLNNHTAQDFNDMIDSMMLNYGINRPIEYTAYQLQTVVPDSKLGNASFDTFNAFKGKRWAAIGTSLTWYDGKQYQNGVHTGEICRGYQAVIASRKPLFVTNLGVSGSTLGDINSSSLINRYQNINWANYDIVTIEYGLNDLGYDIQPGTASDAPGTTTYAACLKTIIEYAFTQNPLIQIVLCTEPAVVDATPNIYGVSIKDYTDVTLEIAKRYSLPVCDWYYRGGINSLNKGGQNSDLLTIDTKHPSDKGHERMAALLNQVFDSMII